MFVLGVWGCCGQGPAWALGELRLRQISVGGLLTCHVRPQGCPTKQAGSHPKCATRCACTCLHVCTGVVSDMMTSRKAAITLGFAMGAAAKFGMSGAAEVGALFTSKAVDRLANGVQVGGSRRFLVALFGWRRLAVGLGACNERWGVAVMGLELGCVLGH